MSDQPTARELALYHAIRSVVWTLRSRDIHFGQDNSENMAYWDAISDALGAAFYNPEGKPLCVDCGEYIAGSNGLCDDCGAFHAASANQGASDDLPY